MKENYCATSVRESVDNACCFRPLNNGALRLIFEITRCCNLHCRHCMVPVKPDQNTVLSYERILQLMKELKPNNISKIMITGGEPLLVDGIIDFIAAASQDDVLVDVNSNLTVVDRQKAIELKQAGVREITTSLDGTEAVHCNIRGDRNCFRRTVQAIGFLREENIPVDVVCTLMDGNLDQIAEVVKLAEQLQVSSLTFSGLISAGRAENVIPHYDFNAIRTTLDEFRATSSVPIRTVRLLSTDYSSCHKGIDMIGADHMGYVHPCLQDPLLNTFNLQHHTLAECIAFIRNLPPTKCCCTSII